jgi:hypothetical protein
MAVMTVTIGFGTFCFIFAFLILLCTLVAHAPPSCIRTINMANAKRGGYRQINQALNICAWEGYLDEQQARLPTLEDVEQISPRVLRVLGQNEGKVRRSA